VVDDDEEERLTLSREDLYELAWSKPISELAKDFGISDVGLAKRCRRLRVPLPGRGYWARVDAGQKPYRPKLHQREPQRHDQNTLTVLAVKPREEEGPPTTEETQDSAWLAERLAFEQRPENAIVVEQSPSRWDPVVRIYRDSLRAEMKEVLASRAGHERHEKLPEWRKQRDWNNDGYKWRSMVRSGQRLLDYHKPRAFRVTMETLERALAITNAIGTAGKARGFALRDEEKEGRITVCGHAAELQFRVTELLETKVRPSSWRKGETESYKVPTGRLRITMTNGWREGPIFEDKGDVKLEAVLNRFFVALYKPIVKQWQDAREAKVRREEERLAELRRAEAAKIRAEQERKSATERLQRDELCAEAQKWENAQRIRAYVACVRAVAKRGRDLGAYEVEKHGNGGDTSAVWVEWALRVADELDPAALRREELETGSGRRRMGSSDCGPRKDEI
jgi:hypothetical protein